MQHWIGSMAADAKTLHFQAGGDASDGIEIPMPGIEPDYVMELVAHNKMDFLNYADGAWTLDLDKLREWVDPAPDWMRGTRKIQPTVRGLKTVFHITP